MSIADEIIRQSNRAPVSTAPEGYYEDDLGYWVENNIDQDLAKYAQYLLFRILKKHNNIYIRYGQLYCGHRALSGTAQDVLELVDLPTARCRAGQAAWIFNRLRELSPEIDETKIRVSVDAYWDMDAAELRELTNVRTIRGEDARA